MRHWGDGVISIETYWNLKVAVGPSAAMTRSGLDVDLSLSVIDGLPEPFEIVLDRAANEPRPGVDRGPGTFSAHAVRVRAMDGGFLITADGVRIAYLTKTPAEEIGGDVDVIIAESPRRLIKRLRPRLVVPLGAEVIEGLDVIRPPGNTIAVVAGALFPDVPPQVARLGTRPWTMPAELAELLARKEAAARASAEVFAPLSVGQMNHRPANGTHTPRWNAEHMMGRELGFFTRIYAGLEPGFPHLDLNPAQMPDDYVAAHPDWSGAEEARQIERVQALVRRFAYLLAGQDLDAKPAGSWWTLRRLLVQMERHYGEHTAHVRAKLDEPDWPAE